MSSEVGGGRELKVMFKTEESFIKEGKWKATAFEDEAAFE